MSIPPVPVLIPKAELNEHPLYRRERGVHRPWMLRGRVPPVVAIPLMAVLILLDAVFLGRSVRFPFDADFLLVGVYAVAALREVRVGLRMIELRTSGTCQELYLSAWSPVETHAAFVIGNRPPPCEYVLIAVITVTMAILIPEFTVPIVIITFIVGLSILSGRRNSQDSYKLNPAQGIWMLEARSLNGLLARGLSDNIWILFILPFSSMGFLGVFLELGVLVILFQRMQKPRKIQKLDSDQLNDYLGRLIKGEEAVKL